MSHSLTVSKMNLFIRKPNVRCRTVDLQRHQPLYKSIQDPALRQAVGPVLNQTGQTVTSRDLVFLQINSDKRAANTETPGGSQVMCNAPPCQQNMCVTLFFCVMVRILHPEFMSCYAYYNFVLLLYH